MHKSVNNLMMLRGQGVLPLRDPKNQGVLCRLEKKRSTTNANLKRINVINSNYNFRTFILGIARDNQK